MNPLATPAAKNATTAPLRLVAGLLALVLFAACGGEGDGDGPEADPTTPSETDSATTEAAEDYVDVPRGVELTEPGTELELGEAAGVAWEPRQEKVAAARVRVRTVERTSFDEAFQGFRITDEMSAMTPFFVRTQVINPTTANLGSLNVPVHLRDDAGTLVEATTLQGSFPACPGSTLPKRFAKGASTTICSVFLLSPGRSFDGVAFQLPGSLPPVTWDGKVQKYRAKQQGQQNRQSGDNQS